jgi:hypothetical protein
MVRLEKAKVEKQNTYLIVPVIQIVEAEKGFWKLTELENGI